MVEHSFSISREEEKSDKFGEHYGTRGSLMEVFMGARGPKKGEGGRPRVSNPKPREDGYKRVTKGPPGNGEQMYEHRAKKGLSPGSGSYSGKEGVVDHKNRKRGDNSAENLRVVSKKKNRENTKKG